MGVYDDGTGGNTGGMSFDMNDFMGGGGDGHPLFQMFFGSGSFNNFNMGGMSEGMGGMGGGFGSGSQRGSQRSAGGPGMRFRFG